MGIMAKAIVISYLGEFAPNNGRSLKDHLFDVLRGEEGVGGPQNQASKQIFDLDRYINVPTYRSQLNNFSNSSTFQCRYN